MKFILWAKQQLTDPTSVLHFMGIVTIGGEVARHWITGHPVDLGTIGSGTGCFTIGGTIDYFQSKTAP